MNNIVFFDGVCNLCNASVNFIIDRDSKRHFKFAVLQSDFARDTLSAFDHNPENLKTIVLVKDAKLYTRSSAVLHIARQLDGWWPIFYVFMIIPPFIRNGVYNIIVNHRYKWFGKTEHCRIPTPELQERFI